MNYRRGEIYYICKTITCGSEQEAGRPAIIVSNDVNNATSPIIEVVYLTTQEKAPLPTHVEINATGVKSTALCEQIQTASVNRLSGYVGRCSDEEMKAVEKAMAISLGMSADTSSTTNSTPDTKAPESPNVVALEAELKVYKDMYASLLDRLTK